MTVPSSGWSNCDGSKGGSCGVLEQQGWRRGGGQGGWMGRQRHKNPPDLKGGDRCSFPVSNRWSTLLSMKQADDPLMSLAML